MEMFGIPPHMDVCTAFLDDGETPCGRYDECTTVTVHAGGRTLVRAVCSRCRERLDLPECDVEMSAGGPPGRA